MAYLAPGKKLEDYHVPEPKQQSGHPHYPRYVHDEEGKPRHLVTTQEEHRARFPEDHAALLAEHGTLDWEPPAAPEPPAVAVKEEPKPLSPDYPRWETMKNSPDDKPHRVLINTPEEHEARRNQLKSVEMDTPAPLAVEPQKESE